MELERLAVDGSMIRVAYPAAPDAPSPAGHQSRAYFRRSGNPTVLIESAMIGYADYLRRCSEHRPDLVVREERTSGIQDGVLTIALVDQLSSGLVDGDAAVGAFSMIMVERRYGCLFSTTSVDDTESLAEFLASTAYEDSPSGIALDLEPDVSIKAPIYSHYLPSAGLLIGSPIVAANSAQVPSSAEGSEAGQGGMVFVGAGRAVSRTIVGSNTIARLHQTSENDHPESAALGLTFEWN